MKNHVKAYYKAFNYDEKYQRGIRWDVVKRCVSREIAEIRIKHHNKHL